MPLKEAGRAEQWREVDRWGGGVGWIAHPDEQMQRASHALAVDDGVWVIDPVDTPDLDDLLAEFGDVVGVAVLLDRHTRDAEAVADRHDVAVSVPAWMDGVADESGVPVERFEGRLPGTDYRVIRVVNNRLWQEAALHDPDGGTLLVPEAVGTVRYFLTGDRRLGVHPGLRPVPPRGALGGLEPDRLLVGHGEGIFDAAADELEAALAAARRTAPRLYAKAFLDLFRG